MLLREQGTETGMDVKEAARTAKAYVADLYAGEAITNVGLEEVEFDDRSNDWKITIGFSRPWDRKANLAAALAAGTPARSYKVVRIADDDGHIVSLRDRLLTAAR